MYKALNKLVTNQKAHASDIWPVAWWGGALQSLLKWLTLIQLQGHRGQKYSNL